MPMTHHHPAFSPQFTGIDAQVLSQQTRYRGFMQVEVLQLQHRLFASGHFGPIISREIVRRRQAAGVFVYDPLLHKFLLIEQFRAGALKSSSPWQLEIIAGLVDEGETPLSCVQREALEEANCQILDAQLIHQYHTSTGASDEQFYFYAASADLSRAGGIYGLASESEDIRVHVFDYTDLDSLLSQGHIRNAQLLIAMQWFQLFLAQHN
jgi:ADP-ribose pyrophosphatase